MSEHAVPPADPNAPVVFFKRNNKGKSTFRKRAATPPPVDSDSDDNDSSSDETPGGSKRPIKKRKQNTGVVTASSSDPKKAANGEPDVGAAKYEAASRDMVTSAKGEATKQSNWYDGDEGQISERKASKPTGDLEEQDLATYKGAASYGNFIKKSEDAVKKSVGPVKAPTNIRTITVTDYAPDVCKDYKLTGFCGFGDTCKFLHAREDYAAGWKLDREWEIKSKGGKMPELQGKRMGTGWKPKDEEKQEEIPFKCVICKGDYKFPIQTKCGHYFCEKCAIERYKNKNPSCAICGRGTDGVFNGAKGFKKLLEAAKEREEERLKEEEDPEEAKK
ncbi:hypothetical protein FPQ18DRAFT_352614 [Pyronema domesticum]|uniref:Pre-mRNA-splicing factor CWC24 n=1 Tax=Pyronema omphalodes (strain CBS 100304) TaxID=1076935 RepID=U4LV56_PYROM|nr:hypothetical protein FPQ18DRAFT_352614 [Pyronema domesticum]CCX32241.1 Similar to Pre-mRNA-splicing factor cwc24; acc. no. Q4WUA0 [Pyronema omphalodes CBS 100304]